MKLAEAKALSTEVCALIQSGFRSPIRTLVVGSIRRGKAEVNDIDIVTQMDCIQWQQVRWVLDITAPVQVRSGGADMVTFDFKGVHVDLYRARPATDKIPSNWGSLVVCRTGSRDFNKWLAGTAQKMGRRWQPHEGIYRLREDGTEELIPCDLEELIFAAVGWSYINPEERSI